MNEKHHKPGDVIALADGTRGRVVSVGDVGLIVAIEGASGRHFVKVDNELRIVWRTTRPVQAIAAIAASNGPINLRNATATTDRARRIALAHGQHVAASSAAIDLRNATATTDRERRIMLAHGAASTDLPKWPAVANMAPTYQNPDPQTVAARVASAHNLGASRCTR